MLNMYRALLCPSSGARDYDVIYHIDHVVLGLLYVGGKVQLGWSGIQTAGYSLCKFRNYMQVYFPTRLWYVLLQHRNKYLAYVYWAVHHLDS